ncbi:charged multivesicular body protein 2a isoform X1 [Zonotrichia albicollis]|uniref:charged multivesicular body protein 2a isoform X1 n=1 Tax=Zonotrichia albicollis TaxID=44394 RepID=UPI003D81109C
MAQSHSQYIPVPPVPLPVYPSTPNFHSQYIPVSPPSAPSTPSSIPSTSQYPQFPIPVQTSTSQYPRYPHPPHTPWPPGVAPPEVAAPAAPLAAPVPEVAALSPPLWFAPPLSEPCVACPKRGDVIVCGSAGAEPVSPGVPWSCCSGAGAPRRSCSGRTSAPWPCVSLSLCVPVCHCAHSDGCPQCPHVSLLSPGVPWSCCSGAGAPRRSCSGRTSAPSPAPCGSWSGSGRSSRRRRRKSSWTSRKWPSRARWTRCGCWPRPWCTHGATSASSSPWPCVPVSLSLCPLCPQDPVPMSLTLSPCP